MIQGARAIYAALCGVAYGGWGLRVGTQGRVDPQLLIMHLSLKLFNFPRARFLYTSTLVDSPSIPLLSILLTYCNNISGI